MRNRKLNTWLKKVNLSSWTLETSLWIASCSFFAIEQNVKRILCSSNTTILLIKITVYWNGDKKAMKMTNTGHTDKKKAQCVLWTVKGLRGAAIQRNIFGSYNIIAPLMCKTIIWYQWYRNSGSNSCRGLLKSHKSARKRKNRLKRCFKPAQDVCHEMSELLWGCTTHLFGRSYAGI